MKKYALVLLALLLLLPAVLASGEALDVAVPEYVRPYAPAEITVTCPDAGELTLRVSDDYVRPGRTALPGMAWGIMPRRCSAGRIR